MATKGKKITERTPEDGLARVRIIFHAIAALIALAGLADATYLTVAHLAGDHSVCGPSEGCFIVLGSIYASIHGVPTAALGMVGYFAAFSAAVLAFGYARARFFLLGVVGAMFLGTLWLLYLQAFVLHAFCPLCLLSAAFTFCLAGLVLAAPSSRSGAVAAEIPAVRKERGS
ncbi:MAG: vitamin K epoxide reductase family protein [Chthoniobacterales bacterium]